MYVNPSTLHPLFYLKINNIYSSYNKFFLKKLKNRIKINIKPVAMTENNNR